MFDAHDGHFTDSAESCSSSVFFGFLPKGSGISELNGLALHICSPLIPAEQFLGLYLKGYYSIFGGGGAGSRVFGVYARRDDTPHGGIHENVKKTGRFVKDICKTARICLKPSRKHLFLL